MVSQEICKKNTQYCDLVDVRPNKFLVFASPQLSLLYVTLNPNPNPNPNPTLQSVPMPCLAQKLILSRANVGMRDKNGWVESHGRVCEYTKWIDACRPKIAES